jgi:fatty-acyl-CoA synthase
VPDWAVDYATVVASPVDEVVPASPLSGDDLLFLYTGGTTGMPKGVMWRHEDLITVLGRGANAILGIPEGADVGELVDRVGQEWPSHTTHVACPLMHVFMHKGHDGHGNHSPAPDQSRRLNSDRD